MNFLHLFSGTTRKLIIATIVFLSYGYLCRLIPLNFFWESKTVGWILFFVAAIFMLRDRIKVLKLRDKKVLLEKVGIGLSIFILLIGCVWFFAIPQATAYDHAVHFIKTDPGMQNEVGTVNGVFLVPTGAMNVTTDSKGSTGDASLSFIVKGSKKYIDLDMLIVKDFDTDWQVRLWGESGRELIHTVGKSGFQDR